MIHFLVHGTDDNVAVAVVNVSQGDTGRVMNMETREEFDISALSDIPLGHKVALSELKKDDTIIKYDHDIGRVVTPIKKGEHVHVHNVKTKRW